MTPELRSLISDLADDEPHNGFAEPEDLRDLAPAELAVIVNEDEYVYGDSMAEDECFATIKRLLSTTTGDELRRGIGEAVLKAMQGYAKYYVLHNVQHECSMRELAG